MCAVMLDVDLGVRPGACTSPRGWALCAAVDEILGGPWPSMARLTGAFNAIAADMSVAADRRVAAASLVDQFDELARHTLLGQALFGDGELLDLSGADYVVFEAGHLVLPQRYETAPHLRRRLGPEKRIGEALLYLLAAIASEAAGADVDRVGLWVLDEASPVVVSPAVRALAEGLLRRSRSHRTPVLVVAQDAADVEGLADYFRYWCFAFRHHDSAGAVRALRGMGMPVSAEAMAEVLTDLNVPAGACLFGEGGRVRRVRFREASDAVLGAALQSFVVTVGEAGPGAPE
jgi:hypothetical protein